MRSRSFVIVFCVILFTVSSARTFAQYPGFKPVTDISGFKKKFAEESEKVKSITSDFVQEKTLVALTETITSSGKFWFKRSDRVRIEYVKPFKYLLVMNGDKLLVRDNDRENKINVKSNKLFQQVNRIMIDCVQGTILDSKDFTTKVFENDKNYLLEMKPASKALREFFDVIVLTVDKSDYSARSIEMNEPAGDTTTIFFENKKLNEAVADAVFAL